MNPQIFVQFPEMVESHPDHGVWICIDQDADAILDEIDEMRIEEGFPIDTNWEIIDVEDMPDWYINYEDDLEKISQIGQGITENEDNYVVFVELFDVIDPDEFDDHWFGRFESMSEVGWYVLEMWHQELYDLLNDRNLLRYFDVEYLAKDVLSEMTYTEQDNTLYVFFS